MRSNTFRLNLWRMGLAGAVWLAASSMQAQSPQDFAVDLGATVSTETPFITLTWNQRQQGKITAQRVHRRLKEEAGWTLLANLATNATSFADHTASPGVAYEYWMERSFTGLYPSPAMGYLSAGVDLPEVEARGTLLLVVEQGLLEPLAVEIALLRQDLVGDGWIVQTLPAARAAAAADVKDLIRAAHAADPANVKMVYLLGHVPVPYSGLMAPDGHGDHVGAWPADGYYGDVDGVWTDSSVYSMAAADPRNRNVPGDGKFDQNNFPSPIELMVGRVDFHGMTRAPSPATTELALLRRYLRKAHDFRHKQGAYADIARRSLVRDGFGYFGGEIFAVSGWAWAFTGVGRTVDRGPWFSPDYAGGKNYLVAYGNGSGGVEYAESVGNTSDFGRRTSLAVFTSLFGSWFGDWDTENSFLRAPLAGNATGDSLGLTCFWGGRPNRVMHPLGMGEPVGYAMRLSQNSSLPGGGGYTPNMSAGVHSALMGDPALRMHVVAPPRNLAATSTNGVVSLTWDDGETEILGCHVYRADTPEGPFTRLTSDPVESGEFHDADATGGTSPCYSVRTLKVETSPGGTYRNLSVGAFATTTVRPGPTPAPERPSALTAIQHTSREAALAWTVSGDGAAGFRVERATDADGAFTPVAALPAGASAWVDAGVFQPGTCYHYRVVATNGVEESPASEIASFEAEAGCFDLSGTILKADPASGVATIAVTRFGGLCGSVSVGYSTSDSSAFAGVHYAPVAGVLTWEDGEAGAKTVDVPLLETDPPQPGRQFRFTLAAPGGGASLGVYASAAVLIEAPGGELPEPWSQTSLGTVTDFAPATFEEGGIGSTTLGGSGAINGYSTDNGRFVHQSRTGDGMLVAYIPAGLPADSSARYALMVRESTGNSVRMAAAIAGSGADFGAKLIARTTPSTGCAAQPVAANAFRAPCWLRLSRAGQVFTAEASTDGEIWTVLGTSTIATMPATALWGFFSYSKNWNANRDYQGNFHFAQALNFALTDLPPPSAPVVSASAASASSIVLRWQAVARAVAYRVERRTESGAFALLAEVAASTLVHTDTALSADTAYAYRVIASNPSGEGEPSAEAWAATPPAEPSPIPLRAANLTAAPGGGWSVALAWQDNATNETGFLIERRVGAGAFAALHTAEPDAAAFTDATTEPGLSYEYRIRPFNAHGDADWTPVAAITTATPATASSTVWDGGGADAGVGTAANWDYDTLPAFDGSATLVFGTDGAEAVVDADIQAHGVVIDRDADFALSSGAGALTLGEGGLWIAPPGGASRQHEVACDTTLAGQQEWTLANNGAEIPAVTVTGRISGGPDAALTQSGNGMLVLAGDNLLEGVIAVRTGAVLRVAHDRALGSPSVGTSVEAGGRLEASGGIAVAEPLALAGLAGSEDVDALRSIGGANVWSGPILLNGARIAVTDGALDVTGGLTGSGGTLASAAGSVLRVAGKPVRFDAGSLAVRPGGGLCVLDVAGNAWSALSLAEGILRTDRAGSLAMGAPLAMLPGATLDLNGHDQTVGGLSSSGGAGLRTVTSGTAATLTVGTSGATTFDGLLTGALGLRHAGLGTLTLRGSNTLSGDVDVLCGSLVVASSSSLGSSAAVTVHGVLDLQAAEAIADHARLDIRRGGRVSVAAGQVETVDQLLLDGVDTGSGTWGPTGSGAEHVDDVHFAPGGRVRVLSSFPPSIVETPADATVPPGQVAHFEVLAAGSVPLFYQWRRDGVDIVGATGSAYATPPTTEADDGAVFSVTVSNALGSATSGGATLTVRDTSLHRLPYRESFERFEPGFLLPGFEGWGGDFADSARVSDDAVAAAALQAYDGVVGLPLRDEPHAQVAAVDGSLTNRLEALHGVAVWADMMVEVSRRSQDLPPVASGAHCALSVDRGGRLHVWHRDLAAGTNVWTALAWQAAGSSQWVRATAQFDYATVDAVHGARYFRLYIDGAPQTHALAFTANDGGGAPDGPWFAMAADDPVQLNEVVFEGRVGVDDLVVGTERPPIGVGPLGTPEWWLADHGLLGDGDLEAAEAADADGDGFANWKEHAAGTAPDDPESALRTIDLPPAPNGRLALAIQTVPGRRYALEGAAEPSGAAWLPIAFATTPDGACTLQTVTASADRLTLYVEATEPSLFCRVRLER